MKTLMLITGLLFVCACSKRIHPDSQSISWITNDSVHVEELVRIDTVYIKGDTVRLTEQIDCDKVTNKPVPSTVHAKTGRGSIDIVVDKTGKLTAIAICDSLAELISVKDKEIFRLRNESRKTVTVPPVQHKTRTIDVICRYISGGFLLLLIGFIGGKLLKFI